jgi:FMN reductase (NADPH)
MNETTRQMLAHRSIRRFKDDPVPEADIAEAVRAGQAAATSSAVQAYSAIRVRDAGTRAEISEIAGPQEKVVRCGAFFVVCGDTRRHRLLCERAGVGYADTFENFLVSVIDASLFAQNATLAFESMGYGTCYIGGVRNDLGAVRRVLGLPTGVYPLFGLCVGLADERPGARPRLEHDAVLFDDAYPDDDTLLDGVGRYDAVYGAYLAERGAQVRGWSEAMVDKHAKPTRADAGGFYASQGAVLA